MAVYSLNLYRHFGTPEVPVCLMACHELDRFGYFQRPILKGAFEETCSDLVAQLPAGSRASGTVPDHDFLCFAAANADDELAAALVADATVEPEAAYELLWRAIDTFSDAHPGSLEAYTEDAGLRLAPVEQLFAAVNNPGGLRLALDESQASRTASI
eukprot:TRINITY_DN2986_c0_g1_i1.p4 TRINITY_DN2986_c0_g1~~TRINITY_DN2986_c0_g1_i1.p4  ORF type:complete len:157 (-),score=17.75 TRINITY_DN2986_c0_g1_i1:1785-2255(-)